MNPPKMLLVIEDDPYCLKTYKSLLPAMVSNQTEIWCAGLKSQDGPVEVSQSEVATAAMRMLIEKKGKEEICGVILDIMMRKGRLQYEKECIRYPGFQLYLNIRKMYPDIPIIIISGLDAEDPDIMEIEKRDLNVKWLLKPLPFSKEERENIVAFLAKDKH